MGGFEDVEDDSPKPSPSAEELLDDATGVIGLDSEASGSKARGGINDDPEADDSSDDSLDELDVSFASSVAIPANGL